MAGIAWVNGELRPPEQAAVSPLDGGFMYGEGLFETMRAYAGRVFRLEEHLERLILSAAELSMAPPLASDLASAVREAVVGSGLDDASVRLTVTPGITGANRPTVVVLVRPLALPPPDLYQSGCLAVSVPAAQAGETPLRRIKSLNYLDKLLSQRAAERRGGHEAILVDPDGCVVEAAMRNVFAVLAGVLVTPPLSRGCLAGVTRAAVIEIAKSRAIRVSERDLPLSELYSAEEAFLTSSVAEIIPVRSVDGNPLPQSPGPVTLDLARRYRELAAG